MLEINTIHQGDCLELMRDIPDKSIDMIQSEWSEMKANLMDYLL